MVRRTGGSGRLGVKPTNAGVAVEPTIKREDRVDVVALHDGKMHGVASGETRGAKDDSPSALHLGHVNREHLVDEAEQSIKRRLDRIAPLIGDVGYGLSADQFRRNPNPTKSL